MKNWNTKSLGSLAYRIKCIKNFKMADFDSLTDSIFKVGCFY